MTTQTEIPTTRDRLVEAGTALLLEGGTSALTWRKCAARAGVSHAAPTYYFPTLADLLTAIAVRAFERFGQCLSDSRGRAAPDPRSQIIGLTAGYLDFAKTYAGLFHLMFTDPAVDRANPDFQRASALGYLPLRECCAAFATGKAAEELEITVWSAVHGFAMLGFHTVPPEKRLFPEIRDFAVLLENILPPTP